MATNKDSFTYGFFNSLNHDRRYNASQMSKIFDGIIEDGVYETIGDQFKITATDQANTVKIGTGRAWFDHTWSLNDAEILFDELPDPDLLRYRYDAIILDINSLDETRANDITVISGAVATISGTVYAASSASMSSYNPQINPPMPTLIKETNHHQYPLCYILRRPNTSIISQADIVYMVGTSACPFVTGPLSSMNIDQLVAQWAAEWIDFRARHEASAEEWFTQQQADFSTWSTQQRTDFSTWSTEQKNAFATWMAGEKTDFDTWFANLQYVLDGDVAGHLQNEIDELNTKTRGMSYGRVGVGQVSSTSIGNSSTSEGFSSNASGFVSHAEGQYTVASGESSHAEGFDTDATGTFSHAEGALTLSSGEASHAEGLQTQATFEQSHAEGYKTLSSGEASHAEGLQNKATGNYSHAEGMNTEASGEASHAEGTNTIAANDSSHAEGFATVDLGFGDHVEGSDTFAADTAGMSHVEGFGGDNNTNKLNSETYGKYGAFGYYEHVEGEQNIARSDGSHVEGKLNEIKTSARYAHVEGENNIANGRGSHIGGRSIESTGNYSFAHGDGSGEVTLLDGSATPSGSRPWSWISNSIFGFPGESLGYAVNVDESSTSDVIVFKDKDNWPSTLSGAIIQDNHGIEINGINLKIINNISSGSYPINLFIPMDQGNYILIADATKYSDVAVIGHSIRLITKTNVSGGTLISVLGKSTTDPLTSVAGATSSDVVSSKYSKYLKIVIGIDRKVNLSLIRVA